MQNDDPFDDAHRTVIIPTPHNPRQRDGAAAEPDLTISEPRLSPQPSPHVPGEPPPEGQGRNPLLRAAAPIFALVRQLRESRHHDDVAGLRRDVVAAINRFTGDARSSRVPQQAADRAKYALCGLIDETVLSTPWGINSVWGRESLLITFYREALAGEKFFHFLNEARDYPRENLDLLELLYVCLSLGFQGRYRVEHDGGSRLARIRQETYALIRQQRGKYERELSPQWRGVEDRRPAVSRFVPLWVVGAVASALILITFFVFSISLNKASDDVFKEIVDLAPRSVEPRSQPELEERREELVPVPPAKPELVVKLRELLADEIDLGLVDVKDLGSAADIVFHSGGLFPSGGAEVSPAMQPILDKIGTFLAEYTMPVTISGHTDNVPIRTARFPSNYHLSKARAESVAAMLLVKIGNADRLNIEGRADSEPIPGTDNATEEGRALNRRVELRVPVTLEAGGTGVIEERSR